MKHYVAIYLAWFASVAATGTSLYWSYVLGWQPCDLCWFQRVCMFPIAVILTVAITRRDKNVFTYILPLSLVGAAISLYNWLMQVFPETFTTGGTCHSPVSCAIPEFAWFGWITPPLLASVSFLFICGCVWPWSAKQQNVFRY